MHFWSASTVPSRLQMVYCRSSVNAETGKVQQRLQFDGDDIVKFEDQLNELVYLLVYLYSCTVNVITSDKIKIISARP